jgi:hypothetical protein
MQQDFINHREADTEEIYNIMFHLCKTLTGHIFNGYNHSLAHHPVIDGGDNLHVAAKILNKESQTANKESSSSLRVGY